MKKYGRILKNIRLQYGYKQEDIAKAIKIDRASISYWENDKRIPTIEHIERLADFYNISIDELIDRDYIGYTRR